MKFVFNGTLDELKETIRAKAKALHKDIVVYHNEPDVLQIGFQRLGHSGGRFFIANVTKKDEKTILTGETKDIFSYNSNGFLSKVWRYIQEFLLEYLVLGFIPFIVWFCAHTFIPIWVPLLIPVPIMLLLELMSRNRNNAADSAFCKFMTMVTSRDISLPTDSRELYKMLMHTQGLHSFPQLKDDVITWELYDSVYLETYMNEYDTCIDIISKNAFHGSYMHWHPDVEDIYGELCTLGKKGNILVLRKRLGGAETYYIGEPNKYRFSPAKKWHWGKLIYLKQK